MSSFTLANGARGRRSLLAELHPRSGNEYSAQMIDRIMAGWKYRLRLGVRNSTCSNDGAVDAPIHFESHE